MKYLNMALMMLLFCGTAFGQVETVKPPATDKVDTTKTEVAAKVDKISRFKAPELTAEASVKSLADKPEITEKSTPLTAEDRAINQKISGKKGNETVPRDEPDSLASMFRVLFSLVVVGGLIFGAYYFVRHFNGKVMGKLRGTHDVQVVGRVSLDPRNSLTVVRTHGEELLIGCSASGTQLIARYPVAPSFEDSLDDATKEIEQEEVGS